MESDRPWQFLLRKEGVVQDSVERVTLGVTECVILDDNIDQQSMEDGFRGNERGKLVLVVLYRRAENYELPVT
jgi:hypothetical protein